MPPPGPAEPFLMTEMGITPEQISARLELADFTPADADRLAAVASVIAIHADEFAEAFLHRVGASSGGDPDHHRAFAEVARPLKAEHLRAMVRGHYGVDYVRQRIELGSIYAKAGLEPRVFLGAFHYLIRMIGVHIMSAYADQPADGLAALMSLSKVSAFDVGLIVDVILFERQRLIELQQRAIRELSTPVLQIRERLLVLPIIGLIDAERAAQLTAALLSAIRSHRARAVIIDVTGVPFVESDVAQYLLRSLAQTARLLGTRVIVTGLSSDAARSVVASAVDFASVRTAGDLQTAVEEAGRFLDR